jgi:hypothetical protein
MHNLVKAKILPYLCTLLQESGNVIDIGLIKF